MHLKCWTVHLRHLSVIPIHSSLRASVASEPPATQSALYIYTSIYEVHMYSAAFQVAGSRCTRDPHNNHRIKQQYPLHKAANQVRADQSTYIRTYVRTCMLCPVLFSWNMEMLAFASRLYAPIMLDRPLTTSVCHSNPFLLASECSVRNRPLRKALCTYILVYTETSTTTIVKSSTSPITITS